MTGRRRFDSLKNVGKSLIAIKDDEGGLRIAPAEVREYLVNRVRIVLFARGVPVRKKLNLLNLLWFKGGRLIRGGAADVDDREPPTLL